MRTRSSRATIATLGAASGATMVDVLVALALTLVVAAGLAQLTGDARALFVSQPEASDLVQRARVSLGSLAQDLELAGAGPYRFADAAPLVQWVPPIHPRRLGPVAADPEGVALADRVTVLTVPDEASQATVGDMDGPDAPVPLLSSLPCTPGEPACGFSEGDAVIVFDATGAFESLVVARAEPGLLVPRIVPLSKAYRRREGARVAGVRIATYYLDSRRRQLRRHDGSRSDVPIADEVIALEVRYFGDALPPDLPRPPPGEENCLVDRDGVLRLPMLRPDRGTLVELTPAMLSDGPWCGVSPHRFDADLYRVRQVRVTMRLQAESPAVRGHDPSRFANAGTASGAAAQVPDLELRIDVSPRNLRAP